MAVRWQSGLHHPVSVYAKQVVRGRLHDQCCPYEIKACQRHLDDLICLNFGELKAFNKLFLDFGNAAGRETDDLDDFIDVVDGNLQAFDNVRTRFGFVQIKADTAFYDFHLVIDVVAEHLL